MGKGRPIAELPIPETVRMEGDDAVRRYQDSFRLAYQAESPVNWCADLGTVLADEEVINGRSERGDYPVERIPLRQWMLRITAYADRLLEDLEPLQWPEPIKEMQKRHSCFDSCQMCYASKVHYLLNASTCQKGKTCLTS